MKNPAQSLPFDILYIIFLICFAEHSGSPFPPTASHVCCRWLSAAISSPVLWSTITFEDERPSWEKYEVWLARSQDAPRTIKISRPFRKSSIKTLGRILRLILPHTKRWTSISLNDVPEKIARIAINRMRVMPLLALRSIDISGLWEESGRYSWKPTTLVHGTPALRDVVVKWVPINSASSFLSNLYTLEFIRQLAHSREDHLNTISLEKYLLTRSPKLHTLKIYADPENSPTSPSKIPPPLLHHHLHILDINFPVSDYLIQHIHAPALVHIRHGGNAAPFPISTLRYLAQWSTVPNMTRAVFYEARHATPDSPPVVVSLRSLPAALGVLSGLQTLEFSGVHFGTGEESLVCLGSVCPQLRSLLLRGCAGLEVENILQVVAVRLKSDTVAHLRTLKILGNFDEFPLAVGVGLKPGMATMGYKIVEQQKYLPHTWKYILDKP